MADMAVFSVACHTALGVPAVMLTLFTQLVPQFRWRTSLNDGVQTLSEIASSVVAAGQLSLRKHACQ